MAKRKIKRSTVDKLCSPPSDTQDRTLLCDALQVKEPFSPPPELHHGALLSDVLQVNESCSLPPDTQVPTCTSFGALTEPKFLGLCEPGTSVLLEGIVWQETEGILVVNVTWRGKSYSGTLLDSSKLDWGPCRFNSFKNDNNNKAGAKRGRGSAASIASNTKSAPGDNVKSRQRNVNVCHNSKTVSPIATNSESEASSPTQGGPKRKAGRPAKLVQLLVPALKPKRRGKTSGSRGNSASQPSSTKLIECPEPNCSKTYKSINGFKYHQAHAHKAPAVVTSNKTPRCAEVYVVKHQTINMSDKEERQQEMQTLASTTPIIASTTPMVTISSPCTLDDAAPSALTRPASQWSTDIGSPNNSNLANDFTMNSDSSMLFFGALNDFDTKKSSMTVLAPDKTSTGPSVYMYEVLDQATNTSFNDESEQEMPMPASSTPFVTPSTSMFTISSTISLNDDTLSTPTVPDSQLPTSTRNSDPVDDFEMNSDFSTLRFVALNEPSNVPKVVATPKTKLNAPVAKMGSPVATFPTPEPSVIQFKTTYLDPVIESTKKQKLEDRLLGKNKSPSSSVAVTLVESKDMERTQSSAEAFKIHPSPETISAQTQPLPMSSLTIDLPLDISTPDNSVNKKIHMSDVFSCTKRTTTTSASTVFLEEQSSSVQSKPRNIKGQPNTKICRFFVAGRLSPCLKRKANRLADFELNALSGKGSKKGLITVSSPTSNGHSFASNSASSGYSSALSVCPSSSSQASRPGSSSACSLVLHAKKADKSCKTIKPSPITSRTCSLDQPCTWRSQPISPVSRHPVLRADEVAKKANKNNKASKASPSTSRPKVLPPMTMILRPRPTAPSRKRRAESFEMAPKRPCLDTGTVPAAHRMPRPKVIGDDEITRILDLEEDVPQQIGGSQHNENSVLQSALQPVFQPVLEPVLQPVVLPVLEPVTQPITTEIFYGLKTVCPMPVAAYYDIFEDDDWD